MTTTDPTPTQRLYTEAEVRELREALERKIDHLLQHCKDAECDICGGIVCPHSEPLHFHHDGCPACSARTPEEIGKSWLENSSLEKWFPFTADELSRLKSDRDTLTAELERVKAELHLAKEDAALWKKSEGGGEQCLRQVRRGVGGGAPRAQKRGSASEWVH